MNYDPFQLQAIEEIKKGHSVIVSAPTGAGKTVIAEHVINTCLATNRCVIYTAPIKALSNQKYRDFQAIADNGRENSSQIMADMAALNICAKPHQTAPGDHQ